MTINFTFEVQKKLFFKLSNASFIKNYNIPVYYKVDDDAKIPYIKIDLLNVSDGVNLVKNQKVYKYNVQVFCNMSMMQKFYFLNDEILQFFKIDFVDKLFLNGDVIQIKTLVKIESSVNNVVSDSLLIGNIVVEFIAEIL